MKPSLPDMVLIVAVTIFALGVFPRHVIERPEDMCKVGHSRYSIMTSGLQPRSRQALSAAALVVFASALGLCFYVRKLGTRFTCENDILRIRRYGRILQSLLVTAGVVITGQVVFAVAGLLTIQHIKYAHIFHSRLFGNLGCLLICLWFFLITYNYIKAFRMTAASVILATKRKT